MTILSAVPGLGNAAITALVGYGVVFGGIVSLMLVILLVGRLASPRKLAELAPGTVEAPHREAVQEITAPGAAGQLKLYDTDPKTAAMLMAIVADKMGKPLNELRFISIKEVK